MWKLRTVCLLSCWALFGCNDTDNGTNAADVQSSVDIVAPVNDVVTNPETDAATEDIQSDTATPADEDTVVVCEPDCGEKDCGDDGCGGSCGECDDGSSCEDHVCVADCVPDCEGKECGDDKCAGTCGACPNDAP